MKAKLRKIQTLMFAREEAKIRSEIDQSNLKNLHCLTAVIAIIESLTLLIWVLNSHMRSHYQAVSLISVSACVAVCAVSFVLISLWRRRDSFSHWAVTLLTIGAYLLMSLWGGVASYRHYIAQEQMLTFFTVQICFVCFVTFRPIIGALLVSGTYAAFFCVLRHADCAAAVNAVNYVVLALISVCAMFGRYMQVVNITSKNINLMENNRKLLYISRHDGLTGMRNRAAFQEDQEAFLHMPVTVFMTDIDYFKQFNDTYGHAVGDRILVQIGQCMKKNFPDANVYRYGGDEFLVMVTKTDISSAEEALRRCQAEVSELRVEGIEERLRFSAGVASGVPSDQGELMSIITLADERLYQIKLSIHKNDA